MALSFFCWWIIVLFILYPDSFNKKSGGWKSRIKQLRVGIHPGSYGSTDAGEGYGIILQTRDAVGGSSQCFQEFLMNTANFQQIEEDYIDLDMLSSWLKSNKYGWVA